MNFFFKVKLLPINKFLVTYGRGVCVTLNIRRKFSLSSYSSLGRTNVL
jgi:hypothetical protein